MEAYSSPYVHLFPRLHFEAIKEMESLLLIKINEVLVEFHIFKVLDIFLTTMTL